jgi:hypothetical protein
MEIKRHEEKIIILNDKILSMRMLIKKLKK